MMEAETEERIREEYGMPPGRLMYHFYHEEEMSAGEIASELDVPRSTAKYWLQRSGVKMRSRTLTDTQRILLVAYISSGIGNGTAASKVACGKSTVYRFRNEIEAMGEPVGMDGDLSSREWDILCEIIQNDIARGTSPEPTSNDATESEQTE